MEIRRILSKTWLHAFLLPIFFLLHAVNEFPGLIPFFAAAKYATYYLLIAGVLIFLARLTLRDWSKAGIWTYSILIIFFFFGPIHDSIKALSISQFFSSYSFLLPFLILLVIIAAIVLRRRNRKFGMLHNYLNILMTILVSLEIIILSYNTFSGKNSSLKLSSNFRDLEISNSIGNDSLPDIFFIVFDEFASTRSLREHLNFDNSGLDSALLCHGFYIANDSKSNYNITNFSLASILNMDFLSNPLEGKVYNAEMLLRSRKAIEESRLPRILKDKGYEIKNYGLFNLGESKVNSSEFFSRYEEKPLYLHTLYGRVRRDIFWNIEVRLNPDIEKENIQKQVARNLQNLENTIREMDVSTKKPRFTYTHLMMPHMPYYFDRNGNPILNPLFVPPADARDSLYLGQLQYTNILIDRILEKTEKTRNRPLVVIIQGDHGYRGDAGDPNRDKQFMNLSAYYFSDRDYSQLYDSISPVNNFRVILNKYFKTNLPLLKDSTILIIPSSESL